ncbi:2-deoxyglucose-6-phosphatase [Shewanella algae]|uniref:hexitol phosphatase HxpB n=1 Tax=Shewanella algae TaxID=38313 RepID=UPI0011821526|nr:hexitol phosphatase HxpB [Shewanella algae]TVL11212.1 2-deoxyglucose-6-phosphatase [Shewanella algae]
MQAPSIQAVIFDMDGILIDSEPVWQQAEYQVLQQLGMTVSREAIQQTTGLRIDQVVDFWLQRFPEVKVEPQYIADQIIAAVIAYIRRDGKPMSGVVDALSTCRSRGLKVGLATSSSWDIIDAVLGKLAITEAFDAIQSAQDFPLGKPHPEVYLSCAAKLALAPSRCLAVEDSFNGLIAARAANMQTLIVPAAEQRQDPRWAAAHYQRDSLEALPALLDTL